MSWHSKAFIVPCLSFLLGACGCFKRIEDTTNAPGTVSAEVTISGDCGGATVGYHTSVKLRRHSFLVDDYEFVWTARGAVEIKPRWLSEKRIELAYRDLDETRIIKKLKTWDGIEIVYSEGSSE